MPTRPLSARSSLLPRSLALSFSETQVAAGFAARTEVLRTCCQPSTIDANAAANHAEEIQWPRLRQSPPPSNSFVPVMDIAPYLAGTPEGKRRVAAELDRACREVGFYIIVGHGVDPRLIEQIETVSREFFDLPLDEKMKVHIGNTPGAVGYAAVGDVVRSRRQISTSRSRLRKLT